MNVLIVHAHPEPQSFCTAMVHRMQSRFEAQGHTVTVSDLYAKQFNPVASATDFAERSNPDYLVYALEQRHAQKTNTLPADIAAELELLKQCDLLVLNFPMFEMSPMKNAVANTEACLANIERHNEITNAFITVMADQALERAAAIDAAAAKAPRSSERRAGLMPSLEMSSTRSLDKKDSGAGCS